MKESLDLIGVDHSPEGIEALRQEIMSLRDDAIHSGEFGIGTVLSHNIALLAYLIVLVKKENNEQ